MSPELYGENAPADSTLTQDQIRAKNPLFSVFQMELGRRSPVVGYTLGQRHQPRERLVAPA